MTTATQSFLALSLLTTALAIPQSSAWAQGAPGPGGKASPGLEDYRKYALTHDGNAARGAALFGDEQKLGCVKCHSVDGRGGKAGPDLFAVGDKFGRGDIITAILQPSASIAVGYTTTIVETKSGSEYTGVVKQTNGDGIQLMGADGKLVRIAATDIKAQRGSSISLMPEGLQSTLSLQDFTDLLDYLVSLRQPESDLVSHAGAPAVLPEIAKPVTARPFFSEKLKAPPGKVMTGLTGMYQIPGQTNVFLVLHQKGLIWKIEKTPSGDQKTVFSDLTEEVFSDRGPDGLLGMTFHPKFLENRKYYLKYQVFEDGVVTTLLMEKQFSADFKQDSGLPPRRLLAIKSVAEDHSGGCVQFGPDGYLYLAMGDTGPQQDPNGHAQNLQLLLGKMLRLDVDHAGDGQAYAIPSDNPFRGRTDARPEIWAYGFRNPWRFSFDRVTGDLWLADVGQDRIEEVDLILPGKNYGWNVYEGFEPFSNQYRKEGRVYTPPLFAYKRKYGASVTGGFVYRGDPHSSFYGVYICGDYVSKRIFGVTQENGILKAARQLGRIPQGLVSFCADESGNLYAVGFEGMVYQLDLSQSHFDELKTE